MPGLLKSMLKAFKSVKIVEAEGTKAVPIMKAVKNRLKEGIDLTGVQDAYADAVKAMPEAAKAVKDTSLKGRLIKWLLPKKAYDSPAFAKPLEEIQIKKSKPLTAGMIKKIKIGAVTLGLGTGYAASRKLED
jgi:hypothetical protein